MTTITFRNEKFPGITIGYQNLRAIVLDLKSIAVRGYEDTEDKAYAKLQVECGGNKITFRDFEDFEDFVSKYPEWQRPDRIEITVDFSHRAYTFNSASKLPPAHRHICLTINAKWGSTTLYVAGHQYEDRDWMARAQVQCTELVRGYRNARKYLGGLVVVGSILLAYLGFVTATKLAIANQNIAWVWLFPLSMFLALIISGLQIAGKIVKKNKIRFKPDEFRANSHNFPYP